MLSGASFSKYSLLIFMGYNNNKGYSEFTIPYILFKRLTGGTSAYSLFLNASTANNTRYAVLKYISDTQFEIKDISNNFTFERIIGIK